MAAGVFGLCGIILNDNEMRRTSNDDTGHRAAVRLFPRSPSIGIGASEES
jgi:hypothetical protein